MVADNQEAELPIDIHCDKIIDWLESRGKLKKKDWPDDIKQLRVKMLEASKSLPPAIKPIVTGSGVTYFTIVKVLEMLVKAKTDTGANVKNFFGSYSDATLQAWDDISKQYRKNNIYLGEAGRQMIRNMHNEIPTLRKTLETNDKQVKDLHRKIAESQANSKKALDKYDKDRAALGIDVSKSEDNRTQLVASISALQPILVDAHTATQSAELEDVILFYREFVKYTLKKSKPDMDVDTHAASLVPLLTRLRSISPQDVKETDDISLDKSENRYIMVSELMELSSFLQSRKKELQASKALTSSIFMGAPTIVRQHDVDKVEKRMAVVEAVLEKVRAPRLQQLVMIRKSTRYVDRLVLSLDASIKTSKRYTKAAEDGQLRLEESENELKQARLNITKTISATKELKASLEEAISQEFEGKKVNIFGDITTL